MGSEQRGLCASQGGAGRSKARPQQQRPRSPQERGALQGRGVSVQAAHHLAGTVLRPVSLQRVTCTSKMAMQVHGQVPGHTTQCKECWREQKVKMYLGSQDAAPRRPENTQSTKTNKPKLQFLRSFSRHLDVPRFPFRSPFCVPEITGEENPAYFHTCV